MKKLIIGLVIGLCLSIPVTSLANTALTTIKASFNSDLPIYINGERFELERGAINYEGTNYLSIREVAEATGLQVKWDAETKAVNLVSEPTQTVDKTVKDDEAVSTTTNDLESKMWVSWDELRTLDRDHYTIGLGARDGNAIIRISQLVGSEKENTEYVAVRDTDYIHNRVERQPYFTMDFLSTFLSPDQLDSLSPVTFNEIP